MRNNGWIELAQSPIAAGFEPESIILVWHAYQGVLTEVCSRLGSNRFYTHWQPLLVEKWIAAAEQLPTKADADAQNCVISRNSFGRISVTGWHRFRLETDLECWQSPPPPPTNFRELRNRQ